MAMCAMHEEPRTSGDAPSPFISSHVRADDECGCP